MNDYSERQRVADAGYREAWKSMPQSTKTELAKAGIVGADCGDEQARRVGLSGDAADLGKNSVLASHEVDFSGAVDKLPDWLMEEFDLTPGQAAGIMEWHEKARAKDEARERSLLLWRMIGFLMQDGNVRIRLHGLAHAARMGRMISVPGFGALVSLRVSAKVLGVSVEAVRKAAWHWVDLLGLHPLDGAKSEEARESYRRDKQTNHWRSQKCKQSKEKK